MDHLEKRAIELEGVGWIPTATPPCLMEAVWVTGFCVLYDNYHFDYLSIGYYDGAEWIPHDNDGEFFFVITHYFPLSKPPLP